MLVLSRKLGESLIIDSDITIKVMSIRGGRVRLGFDAPPDVSIMRSEIEERSILSFERIQPIAGNISAKRKNKEASA